MNLFLQIIMTLIFITILFLSFIQVYKKTKPTILTDEEREEQQKQVYKALRESIVGDSKEMISGVNEKQGLTEGDATNGK